MKRFSKLIALTLALAILPVAAMATDAFGSAAVSEGQTYTLEEMLTYALQDEYMAQAEYVAIQEAFGADNPYTNIIQAELTHQEELIALFEAYGFVVPANTAAEHVQLPATLEETYSIGVQAEINNIAMYEAFLAQGDLPDDVIAVFNELIKGSQSHLAAFTRKVDMTSQGYGMGNGRSQAVSDVQDTTYNQVYGNRMAMMDTTQTYGGRFAAQSVPNGQVSGRMANVTVNSSRFSNWQTDTTGMRGMGRRYATGIQTMDSADCLLLNNDTDGQNVGGGRWN